jgi:predicted xylose isomerase-like sugar epimerase
MQFTYSNSNNYLAGAKEVNDISTNIFNTSRQTGVDVNNLIQTERKARASKADAKNAAEGTIGQKAVNTNAIMKVNQIDAKSKKDVEKIMKPAKMAGALAATVNVGNMGLMMHQDMKLAQERKRLKERRFRNEEYKKAKNEQR